MKRQVEGIPPLVFDPEGSHPKGGRTDMVDSQTDPPEIACLTKRGDPPLSFLGRDFRMRFPEEHTFFAFLALM